MREGRLIVGEEEVSLLLELREDVVRIGLLLRSHAVLTVDIDIEIVREGTGILHHIVIEVGRGIGGSGNAGRVGRSVAVSGGEDSEIAHA